ncbi:hypothetical protein MPOCJGCO_3802 [Methylobacterium trifolii]|uniref:Uncharacterized protein n=1 Tax=Methylobacterium trifolii TaxID=1003092 RepID=A0ABQ4U2H8_9HYPH|nr:hypothetical protein MPOCJGCO_3802 [Methylobacterium trifolii]
MHENYAPIPRLSACGERVGGVYKGDSAGSGLNLGPRAGAAWT